MVGVLMYYIVWSEVEWWSGWGVDPMLRFPRVAVGREDESVKRGHIIWPGGRGWLFYVFVLYI